MISYSYTLQPPGEIIIKETGDKIVSEFIQGNSFKIFSPKEAYLDVRGLKFPLIIRNRKEGDKFHPLGAKGEKKLKDFFIDRKIPLRERNFIPLVLSGNEIVWVAGVEINHRYRVREDTSQMLHLLLQKGQNKEL
ncbi:MAG TPA: hypothetical protein ENG13_05335 [bacterium]|nr:hypothetical protein [bacterium]HEX68463.1 hypothetical protein [bacterium]